MITISKYTNVNKKTYVYINKNIFACNSLLKHTYWKSDTHIYIMKTYTHIQYCKCTCSVTCMFIRLCQSISMEEGFFLYFLTLTSLLDSLWRLGKTEGPIARNGSDPLLSTRSTLHHAALTTASAISGLAGHSVSLGGGSTRRAVVPNCLVAVVMNKSGKRNGLQFYKGTSHAAFWHSPAQAALTCW